MNIQQYYFRQYIISILSRRSFVRHRLRHQSRNRLGTRPWQGIFKYLRRSSYTRFCQRNRWNTALVTISFN